MILILLCTIVTFVTIFAILRSGKSVRHICKEVKFELIYQVLGAKALLEDIVSKKKNKTDLPNKSGQYAIVTGGSRGLGVEIVKMLMQCDMHVIIGCRNVKAGEKLKSLIRKEGIETGELVVLELDTSSIKSVKSFACKIKEKYNQINVLINNAGVMFTPYEESVEGFESQFAVNYLGHFLLTHLLLPLLITAGNETKYDSRIVNVSSIAHFAGDINFEDINMKSQFVTSEAYAQSKLAQVLFTLHLQKLLEGKPVQTLCVHPGICDTDLFDNTPLKKLFPWLPRMIFKSPVEGAISIVYAAVSSRLDHIGGVYISNCKVIPPSPKSLNPQLQEKLFQFSNNLLGIQDFDKIDV